MSSTGFSLPRRFHGGDDDIGRRPVASEHAGPDARDHDSAARPPLESAGPPPTGRGWGRVICTPHNTSHRDTRPALPPLAGQRFSRRDTDLHTLTHSDVDPYTDSDADADTHVNADANTHVNADADTHINADVDTYPDANADTYAYGNGLPGG